MKRWFTALLLLGLGNFFLSGMEKEVVFKDDSVVKKKPLVQLTDFELQLATIKALSTLSLPESDAQHALELFFHSLSLRGKKITDIQKYVTLRHTIELLCDKRRKENNKEYTSLLDPKDVRIAQLDLSENMISVVPVALARLIYLQEIDLSHNKIKEFPWHLGKCFSLGKLDLSHNKIERIEQKNNDDQINTVKSVSLAHNLLSTVPTCFLKSESLRQLDLKGNPLTDADHYKEEERLCLTLPGNQKTDSPSQQSSFNKLFTLSPKQLPKEKK